MCLTVYLASDAPSPTIPWYGEAPGFYVSDRVPALDSVRRHLTKPHVYLVGTHTGCGCGFLWDGVAEDGREQAEVRSMYRGLAEYLRVNAAGRIVQVYVCWGGDEHADPEFRAEIGASEIARDGFAFRERQLLEVDSGK